MTQVFRIGLLGASRIARTAVLAPVADDERFTVVAVAARDPVRAKDYAEAHGVGAVAADYEALISRDDIDVIYNGLPPAGHARWTIAALQAGKAVLCEKPFARSAEEARAMVHAAHAAGRPLLEAFHYRFHRVMRRAQALALGGDLGDLHTGAAEFHVPIPHAEDELRWSAEQGGGALMDLGCYPLHALRTLTGAEPEVASAHMDLRHGVDAATRAEMVFPGGISARIACSMTAERPSAWLRLEGSRGRLDIVNFLAPQLGCRFTATVGGEIREEPTEGPSTYAAQLDHLHAVLTGQSPPLTGGADAIGQMAAVDAIKAAARATTSPARVGSAGVKVERRPPVAVSLAPSNHPYLNGAWTPQHEELDAFDLEVIEGAIPPELDGVYLRNTENPVHQPLGRYHPFDGDGMIHQIEFRDGRADYRNRFVRTRGFEAEQEAGGALWGGLADPPSLARRPGFCAHGALKDASSTDVIVHAGLGLSTFYQCGEGYRLDPLTLETLGVESWVPIDGVSAHPKLDEATGELLFFNYSKHPPYLHFGAVDAANRLTQYRPVPVPGPRLPHDMAFTKHFAILNDLPMFWDAALLERNIHAVRLHEGLPSRFALVPRDGGEVRWFEAAPTYVLHWLNAYEEGEEVVLDGYFQEEPMPAPHADAPAGFGPMMAYLDAHSFRPHLHRWRFNLADGSTREEVLDPRVLEFGTIDPRRAGRPYRYAYSTLLEPGWFLFTGWVKHDLATGESREYRLPPGRFASEAPFAPRPGGTAEDDGWLVSFITDETRGTSECVLIDAARLEEGPVCRIALPHKISSGTHACWAGREALSR